MTDAFPAQQKMSPLQLDFNAWHLIEASAGTGKTYTLSLLFLRLILEDKLKKPDHPPLSTQLPQTAYSVEKIVVMTFTEEATRELKTRIKSVLLEAKYRLEHMKEISEPSDIQSIINHCLKTLSSDQLLLRLNHCILNFDSANISTIHSFCQKILGELSPMYHQKIHFIDDSILIKRYLHDFWRKHLNESDPYTLQIYLHNQIYPDVLLPLIISLYNHREKLAQPKCLPQNKNRLQKIQEQFLQLKTRYKQEKISETLQELRQKNALHKSYKLHEQKTPNFIKNLDHIFSHQHFSDLNPIELKRCDEYSQLLEPNKLQKSIAKKYAQDYQNVITSTFLINFIKFQEGLTQLKLAYLHDLSLMGFEYIEKQIQKKKQKAALLSFDDLLIETFQLLKQTSEKKLHQLREKFPILLVDEFQDTDSLQNAIISMLDPDRKQPFIFVGDPKQAIYGFRGGDIFSYHQMIAKGIPEKNKYSLSKNFRSQARLIDALNQRFLAFNREQDDIKHFPFLDEKIPYQKITAGLSDDAWLLKKDGILQNPLEIHWIDLDIDNVQKVQPGTLIHQKLIQQIQSLLNGSYQLTNKEGTLRTVKQNDILILVRDHKEALTLKQALAVKKIPASINNRKNNIFKQRSCQEFIWWLEALSAPKKISHYKRLFLFPYYQFFSSQQPETVDPKNDDLHIAKIQKYRHYFLQYGLNFTFTQWIQHEKWLPYFIHQFQGKDLFLQWLQLIDLSENFLKKNHQNLLLLINWLKNQSYRKNVTENLLDMEEHFELRQNNDGNRIRIMTIHSAKGLEAPIVFCPSLQREITRKNTSIGKWLRVPDNAQLRWQFNFGNDNELEQKIAQYQFAEDLRLQYVALTRANAQCHLYLYHSKKPSTLLYLLAPSQVSIPNNSVNITEAEIKTFCTQTEQLDDEHHPFIKDQISNPSQFTLDIFRLNQMPEKLNFSWQDSSFSHLTRYNKASEAYDEIDAKTDEPNETPASQPLEEDQNHSTKAFNRLPQGKQLGLFIHDCLESADFSWLANCSIDEFQIFSEKKMRFYGLQKIHTPALYQLIKNTVLSPILPNFSLSQLKEDAYIKEMPILFNVKNIDTQKLNHFLHACLPNSNHHIITQMNKLETIISGFIDLIFIHKGKYYIVDYKSNYLGEDKSAYHVKNMQDAVAHANYHLQYWIYIEALDRYLNHKLKNYKASHDLGGVLYLFIRGLSQDSSEKGIYFDPIDPEKFTAFKQIMRN